MTANRLSEYPRASERDAQQPALVGSSLALLLVHAIGGVILLALLLGVAPRFERIFEDFDYQLPVVTRLLIRLSHLAMKYWYLLLPLVVLDVAAVWSLRRPGAFSRQLRKIWLVASLLLVVGFVVLIVLALVLPLMQLIDALA